MGRGGAGGGQGRAREGGVTDHDVGNRTLTKIKLTNKKRV